jgi:hypothetical protein
MNTKSVQCRKVGFGKMEKVGDLAFDENFAYIYLWLPGVSGPDALQISRTPTSQARVWTWDGNEQLPTLTPSILSPGQWHGYLRAGRLESC